MDSAAKMTIMNFVVTLSRTFSVTLASIFIFSIVLFGGAGNSLAQTTSTSQPGVVLLATVNVVDVKIISQEGSTFRVSFNLTNRQGIQTGVKYGVRLVSDAKGAAVADEKVYPATLTLAENSSVVKEITYTAPENLSGSYTLYITSRNESGLPLALTPAGKVTLTATTKGLAVDPTSCYLKIVGEKGSPHYNLVQGVDIASTENLVLTCTATNGESTALSAVPSFETHYRTIYGAIVKQVGGDSTPISFAAGEKKTFSITLPKAGEPQAYDVSTVLKSGSVSSNAIVAHYVISGSSATVQSIALDKNFYMKGDTATFSFAWSPSADDFPNSRIGKGSPTVTSASVTMTDASGNACITPTQKSLSAGIKINIALLLEKDCNNPHVSLSLVDAAGHPLAQKDLTIISPATSPESTSSTASPVSVLIALGVIVIIGLGAYIMHRKKEVVIQQIP